MGYQTRFDIGETVYFIANEIIEGSVCPVCRVTGPKQSVPTVKRSRIVGIDIGVNGLELYGLTASRVLASRYLYGSREEAEAELARIEKEIAKMAGGTTNDK